jgi:hypothetical protein
MARFLLELIFGARGDELNVFVFITGERMDLTGVWRDFSLFDTLRDLGSSTQHTFYYLTVMPQRGDEVQKAIELSLGISVQVHDEASAINKFLAV